MMQLKVTVTRELERNLDPGEDQEAALDMMVLECQLQGQIIDVNKEVICIPV